MITNYLSSNNAVNVIFHDAANYHGLRSYSCWWKHNNSCLISKYNTPSQSTDKSVTKFTLEVTSQILLHREVFPYMSFLSMSHLLQVHLESKTQKT